MRITYGNWLRGRDNKKYSALGGIDFGAKTDFPRESIARYLVPEIRLYLLETLPSLEKEVARRNIEGTKWAQERRHLFLHGN